MPAGFTDRGVGRPASVQGHARVQGKLHVAPAPETALSRGHMHAPAGRWLARRTRTAPARARTGRIVRSKSGVKPRPRARVARSPSCPSQKPINRARRSLPHHGRRSRFFRRTPAAARALREQPDQSGLGQAMPAASGSSTPRTDTCVLRCTHHPSLMMGQENATTRKICMAPPAAHALRCLSGTSQE